MIEKVIKQISTELHPISGDNLSGFLIDIEYALLESDMFKTVKVSSTEDRECLINAHAVISPEIATIQDLNILLYKVWGRLRYLHFDASSCQWYKEAMFFRFITVSSKYRYFVSGRIIADGVLYSNLVEIFERDFGHINGPLPSICD
jgi:hypothetical protein